MQRFFARLAISIALVLIALVAAMIAVGYFVFALHLWLQEYFIPPVAALASGFIVLFIALILALVSRATMRGRRRYRDERAADVAETAAEIGSLLGERLDGFTRSHGTSTLLAALIAGFAVGVSPKLRSLLWRFFKR